MIRSARQCLAILTLLLLASFSPAAPETVAAQGRPFNPLPARAPSSPQSEIENPKSKIHFAAQDILVYGDALVPAWSDWSWDTTRNFSNPIPVYSGSFSLSAAFTAAWAGLYLHTGAPLSAADYEASTFGSMAASAAAS